MFLFALTHNSAHATLKIEVTHGIKGAMPIAIIPFDIQVNSFNESFSKLISNDLHNSGFFEIIQSHTYPQKVHYSHNLKYKLWRDMGIEHVVVGRVLPSIRSDYAVEFELVDTVRGKRVTGYKIPLRKKSFRKIAHKISDIIYENLTGIPGIFDTRIAYISSIKEKRRKKFTLNIADMDGHNAVPVYISKRELMSPSWSPDGKYLAYVSFEKRHPQVYIQNLAKGTRVRAPDIDNSTSAPAWSPDGNMLAVTISVGNNLEIFTYEIQTRTTKRFTHSLGIDTEAIWRPDGKSIIFTSNRSGKPHLYRQSLNTGKTARLTYEGIYNADADISPDGRYIVMTHNAGQGFKIGLLDTKTGYFRVLTNGMLDEAPSFAPNGRMILYATEQKQGYGILVAVSEDGRIKQKLSLSDGNVREPVWSPYKK